MKAQHSFQRLCLFISLHNVPSQKTFSATVGRLKNTNRNSAKSRCIFWFIVMFTVNPRLSRCSLPRPREKWKFLNNWPPYPQKQYFSTSNFFSLQVCSDRGCYFLSFIPLNIMQYGWKACWNCQTNWMLYSLERSKWFSLILGATPRIWKTAKYEIAKSEGWIYAP